MKQKTSVRLKSISPWGMLFTLFFAIFNAQAQNNTSDCNLSLIKEHPVSICIEQFQKKLSSLAAEDIEYYENQLKKIEQTDNPIYIFDYYYLFQSYPHPKVLLGQLRLKRAIFKATPDEKISYDAPDSLNFSSYQLYLTQYKILIGLLEESKSLSSEEQKTLDQSKQYAHCLNEVLTELFEHQDQTFTNRIIMDQCNS